MADAGAVPDLESRIGAVLTSDAPLRAAWQRGPWTDGNGREIPTQWAFWDDDMRLSAVLPLEGGGNRFVRDVPDDAPLVFVFGRFPLFVPELHVRVTGMDKNGGETVVAETDLAEPASTDFVLTPVAVSNWKGTTPARVAVELSSGAPGCVFMAAHRWTKMPLPALPPHFIADTRLFPAPLDISGTPDSGDAAALAGRRAFVEAHPGDALGHLEYAAAQVRRGRWAEAEPALRRALSLNRGAWAAGTRMFAEEAERRAENGDMNGAVQVLLLARMMDPGDLAHAFRLAQLQAGFGNPDAALAQCREVLLGAPESPRTAALVDGIYAQRADLGGRAAEWRAIAEKRPGAVVPWHHLADALAQAGDQQGAEKARERAQRNDAHSRSTE